MQTQRIEPHPPPAGQCRSERMLVEVQVHRRVVIPEGNAPEPTRLRRIAQPRPERRGDADVRLSKTLHLTRPRSSPNQGKRLAHPNIRKLDGSDHGSFSTPGS